MPWVALVVAALAWMFRREGSEEAGAEFSSRGAGLLALLAALVLGAGAIYGAALHGLAQASYGVAIGAAAVLLASWLNARKPSIPVAALATGVAAASFAAWFPKADREFVGLGIVAGLAFGAWILRAASKEDGDDTVERAAVAALAAVIANAMGARVAQGHIANTGVALGVLASICALVATVVPLGKLGGNKAIRLSIGLVLMLIGGWLAGERYFNVRDVGILFCVAALLGSAACLVESEAEESGNRSSFGFVALVVIWLSAATLAFGLRKGYGMTVALSGGLVAPLLLKNRRAILTMAPLAALVVYRLFRELHADASRALDIGQHYGMIGLLIGASIPLLAIEWRKGREPDSRCAISGFLWVPLFVGLPLVGAVILAAKGYVGILAGLGLASAIVGLAGGARLTPMTLAAGLGTTMVVSYGWLGDKVNLSREDKVHALVSAATLAAVIAVAIFLLSRSASKAQTESK